MKRICFIFAVAGLLIGFAIDYGLLPKGPSGILTEERVEFYQVLYISAKPDSLSIRGTIFHYILHYVVILTNPHDTPVSSYIPDVTVTLTEGNTVVYSRHIAFNMTSPITLGPNEERTIYDGVIAIAECAPKGTYWLQAAAGPCWVPGEYPPTEEIVFITQPTLITLK